MRIRDSIAFVTGANRTRQFKARLSDDVGIYLDFDPNRPAAPAK